MIKNLKWTRYLWLSLLCFSFFLLELAAIFGIEKLFLGVDVWAYTPAQRAQHSLITAALWAAAIAVLLLVSCRRYGLPAEREAGRKSSARDWAAALLCLAGCKVMTWIDWHTLKVIGEARGKTAYEFCAQYLYYLLEVALVCLILFYGQKAFEVKLGRESGFPFGGLVLAASWGAFHFISRGVGLEIWNGVSCMIFSLLAGVIYLKMGKRFFPAYLLIAVGYLL
ncbi:hypothetical protein H8S23_09345 [Anaerofilum sp. BX8]|uniref:Uncharacterized protein n=1 Tax=Anaerofilum hominis TaxID=2763016 RepID=A0A923IA93_9FIRM|nr:hypothetical protein [Anaerofilum hominis]